MLLFSLLRFRVLPITIVACCLFIVVKLVAIVEGKEHLQEVLASSAIAEDAAPEEKEEEVEQEEEKTEDKEEATEEDKKSGEDTKEDTEKEDSAEEGDKEEDKEKDKEKESPKKEDKKKTIKEQTDILTKKCQFNQIEIDLLQSLSARREELEKWADEVRMQENVLKATEMQIDKKLGQMQSLKKNVEELLAKYNSQEDIEMRSLVRIYENMKPKDAARIFNEMEMGILLEVVDRMSERKVAPVLAAMDPKKARDVTMEMAEKRRLKQEATAEMPQDTTTNPTEN